MDWLPENFNAVARWMQNMAATSAESMALESSSRVKFARCHFDQREKSAVAFICQKADFSLRSK